MKTAQIKMFETIAVLVIFFIIILFGFIFYTRVQESTFAAELEEKTILNAIDLSQSVFFLPELQCIGEHKIDCIDILKLDAARNIISSNRADYFDLLGYSNIYVEEIYPESTASILLYDSPKTEDKGQISTQFPISLYDARTDAYSFGVLYIDVYR